MFVATNGDLCFAFCAFFVSVRARSIFCCWWLDNVNGVFASFCWSFAALKQNVRNDRSLNFSSAFPDNVLAAERSTVDDFATDDSAVDNSTIDNSAVDNSTIDNSAADDATVDDATVDDPAISNAAADNAATATATASAATAADRRTNDRRTDDW